MSWILIGAVFVVLLVAGFIVDAVLEVGRRVWNSGE